MILSVLVWIKWLICIIPWQYWLIDCHDPGSRWGTAVQRRAIKPAEFERVIVDTTVQEKAIVHPVDSRLLEIACGKVLQAARRSGITLKQTYAKEGKELRRKTGGLYPCQAIPAHAQNC